MLSMHLPLNFSSVSIISAVILHVFITNLNFVAQNPVWHKTYLFSLLSPQSIDFFKFFGFFCCGTVTTTGDLCRLSDTLF